ncbi:MAG: hypothetical protein WBD25_18115 [Terriglobales bacterium]|jgi:hypothetical protein
MKSLFLCVGVLLACVGCNSNTQAAAPQPVPKVFSEADVTRAQADIKSHYEDQGFEVQQVALIKDSDRHLSGYVKFRRASGIIRPQLTRNCVASMDVDSGKSIWECK